MIRFPNEPTPAQATTGLRSLRNFLLRNRAVFVAVPLLVLGLTAALVYLAPPVYESSTSVRIDENRSNVPILDALQTISSGSQISTEMEVLESRSLAEQVVDSLGLQLSVRSPRRLQRTRLLDAVKVDPAAPEEEIRLERRDARGFEADLDGRAPVSVVPGRPFRIGGVTATLTRAALEHPTIVLHVTPFQDAVKSLRDALTVDRPDHDASIVVLRYKDHDRRLARAVPNVLAARFIAWRQSNLSTQARSTVRFLDEQIDTLQGQLAEAEDALRVFREQDHVIDPTSEAKADIERLADLEGQRDLAEAERAAMAQTLDSAVVAAQRSGDRSPYRSLIAFPSLLKSPAASELLRSLAEAEDARNQLLLRRTPDDPDVQRVTERVHQLEDQVHGITTTYLEGLTNQVSSLDGVLARFGTQLGRIPATQVRYARLERQASVLQEIFSMLEKRRKEAQIAAAVQDASVRVVDPAILALRPVWPKKGLSLALALVVGLTLSAGAAFTREHLDTTLHTREDLQTLTGMPVLGLIPRIGAPAANGNGGGHWRRPGRRAAPPSFASSLVARQAPTGPIAEAYRTLRTNITFSRPEQAPHTLVFTSPTPGDGKSTTAANLAITLAQQELRCLLIDADLRRGVLHRVLETTSEPGLADVLLGRATAAEVIHSIRLPGAASLDFMPRGFLAPNPAELLGSDRMRALLETLGADYDSILLDAPPLNLVTDAALLGTNADGVILVARAGASERGAVAYAVEQLAAVRAPALGAVLNDIDVRKEGYYGSYAPTSSYYAADRGGD